ncbi:MAG: tetratricopeptide repeat protein [Deltaproteobacteria bacterium]|nr:tetratricopeptide repeat protein [Deltaproteobacteria bacterium]
MAIIRNRGKRGQFMKALLAILLASFMLTACLKTPWDYEQAGIHMNLGMAYIESNQYNPALKELLEAEKYTPEDARIHFYLGMAYHAKGLSNKAIAEFNRAIDLKPDYSEAHNFLGILYTNAGQWDMAIAAYNKALTNIVYDTPAAALYNMGWAYYQKGDYSMAMSKYYEALSREPNTVLMPIIEKNMGLASLRLDQVDEAIQHFKKAAAVVPNYIEAQYWLAECYAKKKNWEEAITQFQTLAKAAPESEYGIKAQKRLNDLKQVK